MGTMGTLKVMEFVRKDGRGAVQVSMGARLFIFAPISSSLRTIQIATKGENS